jgi:hypothetical protein
MKKQVIKRIVHAGGFAYRARTFHPGLSSHRRPSSGVLFEDARPLGPATQLHDEIREFGAGRYSFWYLDIYFSASDNSDPRSNGRRYSFGHAERGWREVLVYIPVYWMRDVLSALVAQAWKLARLGLKPLRRALAGTANPARFAWMIARSILASIVRSGPHMLFWSPIYWACFFFVVVARRKDKSAPAA